MSFHFRRRIFVSPEEMNLHLEYVRQFRALRFCNPLVYEEKIGKYAYIDERLIELRLTYKKGKYIATYITRLDGDTRTLMTGGECYNILQRYYKTPKRMVNFSSKQLLWRNTNYDRTRNYAYSYDKNSAFSWAMIQPMPDTNVAPISKKVEKDEIGFDGNGNRVTEGFALFTFPLMDSPYKRFVDRWYKEKKKGNPKAKNVLNFSIGYLQLVNPFLRAQIIGLSNESMLKLIDKNTLYCNTDNIISMTKRDDLVFGNNIGEFKFEREGYFAFDGFNYQWDLDIPSYRGIPKCWFNDGWDILKDPLPPNGNTWVFDKVNLILRKNER